MDAEDRRATREEFRNVVNMSPKELEDWLGTEESRSVGWPKEALGGESVGHHSGRRIVEIKRKRQDDYSEDDYAHMRKVIGYVHRHIEQPPSGDPTRTRWRYSLMNWGHDPLKD